MDSIYRIRLHLRLFALLFSGPLFRLAAGLDLRLRLFPVFRRLFFPGGSHETG